MPRSTPLTLAALLGLTAALAPATEEKPSAEGIAAAFGGEIRPAWRTRESRQYDFWLGHWEGNWRRRPEGEFFHAAEGYRAEHDLLTILDGKAMVELVSGREPNPSGRKTRGFSVRYYDPHRRRWVMAQNWPAPNESSGFTDQLLGGETFGRIEVYSTYLDSRDRQLTRRYSFSDIRDGAFRWDDNYTGDGGKSWTPSSIVEFRRTAERGRWPAAGEAMPSFEDGGHCTEPGFQAFDFLAGGWSGEIRFADGTTSAAALTAFEILDGCGVMSVLEWRRDGETRRLFEARSFRPEPGRWFVYRLDDRSESVHEYQVGSLGEDGRLELVTAPGLVIRDELALYRPDPDPERPERRTVWPALGGDRIGFEMQESDDGGGSWSTAAAVSLERDW